jgi:HD-like signal output (HDOD) protein/DNA-binding NarL/FixJ family response regulator
MKKVLVANKDIHERQKLHEIIGRHYDVKIISNPRELPDDLKEYHLALVDCNFTKTYGLEFLTNIIKQSYLPVLFLAPPDDPRFATEALKLGAFNYIIKTARYYDIINILIKDTVRKFEQRDEMMQTILDLKKRVQELEDQIASGIQLNSSSDKSKEEPRTIIEPIESKPKPRKPAFDDIMDRLKKGQINIPASPKLQIQFDEMIRDQKGIHEIAGLLKQDVSISSHLIGISNSVYFQGLVENSTVEQAVTRLGLITARKYVVIICNRSLYATQKKQSLEWMERLWKHALACGLGAQFICETMKLKQSEELFTLGLFHDIGKLILFQIMAELDAGMVNEDAHERNELLNMISKNHGAFGAMLLKRWGFSSLYQQIAMYHDNPNNADSASKELLVVHFANVIAKSMGYSMQETSSMEIEKALSNNRFEIDESEIAAIKSKIQEHMNNLQQLF